MELPPRLDDAVRRARNFSPRGLLLYLLTVPLVFAFLFSLLRGDVERMALDGAALVLFAYAASLARRGMRIEAEYRRRRVARPPRVPRKTLAAVLLSLGVFGCSHVSVGRDLVTSAGLGLATLMGFFFAYGVDPFRRKMTARETYGYTAEEILEAVEEARSAIARIETASRRIDCPELARRLHHIAGQARSVVDLVEENPRDLRRARKFLNVYLTGARRVSEGYARTHRRAPSEELEASFRNVLVTIEEVFEQQRRKLLDRDAIDVDVQIEVLAKQLEREGVA